MQQPREIIDRVKEATDLPALAEELTSVKLKKHGNSYVGLCPFHNEKTPSFKIKAARRSYYKCFGCGKCGDCFTFVQEVTGRTFGEALQFLAERAQVQLLQRQTTPEAEQARQQREAMAHALRFAADYYETQRQQTPQTRDFLRDHGLNEITAQRFRIGYAPEGMSALIDAAQQAHIAAETLVAAGLAAQHPSGHHYDVFRNRMVFPIRSTSNRIVGFTSRGLTDHPKAPVYRDAPETALYRKGDILYGHEKARPAIRDKGGGPIGGRLHGCDVLASGRPTACRNPLRTRADPQASPKAGPRHQDHDDRPRQHRGQSGGHYPSRRRGAPQRHDALCSRATRSYDPRRLDPHARRSPV